MANAIFAWGCAPTKFVLAETRMVDSFFETLKDRYCRKTLAITFPHEFDHMLFNAGDEQWEIWKTNNIQPCRIFYEKNKVIKQIGVILIHTQCKSMLDISVLPNGKQRDAKLKELYVPLRMINAKCDQKKAEEDFMKLTEKEK